MFSFKWFTLTATEQPHGERQAVLGLADIYYFISRIEESFALV